MLPAQLTTSNVRLCSWCDQEYQFQRRRGPGFCSVCCRVAAHQSAKRSAEELQVLADTGDRIWAEVRDGDSRGAAVPRCRGVRCPLLAPAPRAPAEARPPVRRPWREDRLAHSRRRRAVCVAALHRARADLASRDLLLRFPQGMRRVAGFGDDLCRGALCLEPLAWRAALYLRGALDGS